MLSTPDTWLWKNLSHRAIWEEGFDKLINWSYISVLPLLKCLFPLPPTPKHCSLMWAAARSTGLAGILTQLLLVSKTEGREGGSRGGDLCIPIADSCLCMAETNAILQAIILQLKINCCCSVTEFATPWTAAQEAALSITVSGVCSNSYPLSQWCHPNVSSSAVPFSSCLQSSLASGKGQGEALPWGLRSDGHESGRLGWQPVWLTGT